jgi:hypothetical protein
MTGCIDDNERKDDGFATTSRTVSQADHDRPGGLKTGQEEKELRWAQQHVPEDEPKQRPVRSVFRKTELYGNVSDPGPDAMKKKRKRTEKKLEDPTGTVSCRQLETAFRDFICSLLERQDMIRDELLLHVADLQQRIDALEDRLEKIRYASPGVSEMKG